MYMHMYVCKYIAISALWSCQSISYTCHLSRSRSRCRRILNATCHGHGHGHGHGQFIRQLKLTSAPPPILCKTTTAASNFNDPALSCKMYPAAQMNLYTNAQMFLIHWLCQMCIFCVCDTIHWIELVCYCPPKGRTLNATCHGHGHSRRSLNATWPLCLVIAFTVFDFNKNTKFETYHAMYACTIVYRVLAF